jgi:hypothetical protein
MKKLSNKRRTHAVLYGEAVARSHLNEYVEHPEYFPKGLKSFLEWVPGMAAVNLYAGCTWSPSPEEKNICSEYARRDLETAIRVAETYVQEQKNAGA